jgi:hypothetical protein
MGLIAYLEGEDQMGKTNVLLITGDQQHLNMIGAFSEPLPPTLASGGYPGS